MVSWSHREIKARVSYDIYIKLWNTITHIDGFVQNCSNSSALAMELLQLCAKPPISYFINRWLSKQSLNLANE